VVRLVLVVKVDVAVTVATLAQVVLVESPVTAAILAYQDLVVLLAILDLAGFLA